MIPLGFVFGALAVQSGLDWWRAGLSAALISGGSFEFLLIGMDTVAAPLVSIVVAAFLVNASRSSTSCPSPAPREGLPRQDVQHHRAHRPGAGGLPGRPEHRGKAVHGQAAADLLAALRRQDEELLERLEDSVVGQGRAVAAAANGFRVENGGGWADAARARCGPSPTGCGGDDRTTRHAGACSHRLPPRCAVGTTDGNVRSVRPSVDAAGAAGAAGASSADVAAVACRRPRGGPRAHPRIGRCGSVIVRARSGHTADLASTTVIAQHARSSASRPCGPGGLPPAADPLPVCPGRRGTA
ncbi:AzlC family ABC transporter permease [Streptomyces sp. NPDC014344]|uniref:AzlC family ABC transporter permease n=1 Tax=Streptomyces sp. NPDC014344 TaxID=3364871 RepID=UPI0036FBAB98